MYQRKVVVRLIANDIKGITSLCRVRIRLVLSNFPRLQTGPFGVQLLVCGLFRFSCRETRNYRKDSLHLTLFMLATSPVPELPGDTVTGRFTLDSCYVSVTGVRVRRDPCGECLWGDLWRKVGSKNLSRTAGGIGSM